MQSKKQKGNLYTKNDKKGSLPLIKWSISIHNQDNTILTLPYRLVYKKVVSIGVIITFKVIFTLLEYVPTILSSYVINICFVLFKQREGLQWTCNQNTNYVTNHKVPRSLDESFSIYNDRQWQKLNFRARAQATWSIECLSVFSID